MKMAEHFIDFLDNTVNLNQSRIDDLETKVGNIEKFIQNSSWDASIIGFEPQGSWAHETIIKPVKNKGFDADLIVYVNPADQFEAKDYVNKLTQEFRSSGIYADKTKSYSHCVTIEYAGEFNIDIAPCVVNRQGFENKEVCNRTENEYEKSEPTLYTEWIKDRNEWSGSHGLVEVTRLIKYLRDIKQTFTCQSILLTTLLANQIYITDRYSSEFEDLPSSLQTIMGRLDNWLQANEAKPEIRNPVNNEQDFSELWTDEQYQNFRDTIARYREWIDEAINETEYVESIKKWRRVFQNEFAKGEAASRATQVVKALAESVQVGWDFVDAVKAKGAELLQNMPRNFPHMEILSNKPSTQQLPVRIVAHEKPNQNGVRSRALSSGEPVPACSGIEFQAVQFAGAGFPKDYEIKWQIVNTDAHAANDNCLRGEICLSHTHGYRWEATKYRGVHWVQAFVINKRTNRLCGSSDRFFVVIE